MSLRLFVCLLPPFLRWFICGCALLLGEATKQISLISTPDGIEVLDLGLDLRDWPTAKFIFKFLQILRVVSSELFIAGVDFGIHTCQRFNHNAP